MPWEIGDVDSHKAGLTDAEKEQWVAVANSALETCLEDGGDADTCEASAIKQANGVVGEPAETEAEEVREAATIKSLVQGFLRAAHALLGEKTLPKTIKEQIENLRGSMRKTWKDLESEIEPEPTEEASLVTESAIIGDVIPLIERAVRADGTARIKVIAPGVGKTGYYSEEVLKRDGPQVFARGLQSFWDHPTVTEEDERPERSLRDLAGVLVSDAAWQEGPAGPGLYADMQVFEPFRASIEELAPHIGMSIRGLGKASSGEVDGQTMPVIEEIVSAKSVDVVTQPGAGGQVVQLFESARKRANNETEVNNVTEQEAKELMDENEALKAELAKVNEAALMAEAREFVANAMPKDLPELTQARLRDMLNTKPVIAEGKLDVEAYRGVIEAAIKAEREYLAAVSESGRIVGMGGKPPVDGGVQLKESFKKMYLRRGMSVEEAERLSDLAAQSR